MAGSKVGYLTIQNFRYGLDARRSELTSQPGTLLRAIDCHINQGAEIEKRKAFVKTALPANVFLGLAALNTQYAFGSIAAPIMPSGFTYQRLTSPIGSAMTALIGATLYNNQVFVVATFGTDGTFVFYNGVLVLDYTAGVVLPTLTANATLANQLQALLAATIPYANSIVDGFVNTQVDVESIQGSNYSTTITTTLQAGSTGVLTSIPENQGTPGTPGSAAIGQFTISFAPLPGGGAKLQAIQVTKPGASAVYLFNGSVLSTGNIQTTALAIAEAVNTYCKANTKPFSAYSNGATVILQTTAFDASYNGSIISLNTTSGSNGPMLTDACAIRLEGTTFTISSIGIDLGAGQPGTALTSKTFTYPGAYASFTLLLEDIAADITSNGDGNLYGAGTDGVNTIYISRYAVQSNSAKQTIWVNFSTVGDALTNSSNAAGSFQIQVPATLPAVKLTRVTPKVGFSYLQGTTSALVVNTVGGQAPFSYDWIVLSAPSGLSIIATNPGSAQTAFRVVASSVTGLSPTSPLQVQVYCRVTDSSSPSLVTNSSPVVFSVVG